MSQHQTEELGESLAIGILTALMEFSDMLDESGDYPKARILMALLDDAQGQLECVFNQINKIDADIRVQRPYRA